LAEIWSQVLRVGAVGVTDNFFELGGDSILAIQIAARAHDVGLRLLPRHIFEHQTVAALATVAIEESAERADVDALMGAVGLTPAQRACIEGGDGDSDSASEGRVLTTAGPLDPEALGRALGAVVAHHEALRLRFH